MLKLMRSCPQLALLHSSSANWNTPNLRRRSGDAFETEVAKFSHPAENTCANLGFCYLIFQGKGLNFAPMTVSQRPICVSLRLRWF